LAKLEVYIGSTEEDPFGSYLCISLIFSDGTEVPLEDSEDIGSCTGPEFVMLLEKFFNRANLFSKDLALPVRLQMDEFITLCLEENFTEEVIQQVKSILREIRSIKPK
jgi:hypothetical protein